MMIFLFVSRSFVWFPLISTLSLSACLFPYFLLSLSLLVIPFSFLLFPVCFLSFPYFLHAQSLHFCSKFIFFHYFCAICEAYIRIFYACSFPLWLFFVSFFPSNFIICVCPPFYFSHAYMFLQSCLLLVSCSFVHPMFPSLFIFAPCLLVPSTSFSFYVALGRSCVGPLGEKQGFQPYFLAVPLNSAVSLFLYYLQLIHADVEK